MRTTSYVLTQEQPQAVVECARYESPDDSFDLLAGEVVGHEVIEHPNDEQDLLISAKLYILELSSIEALYADSNRVHGNEAQEYAKEFQDFDFRGGPGQQATELFLFLHFLFLDDIGSLLLHRSM